MQQESNGFVSQLHYDSLRVKLCLYKHLSCHGKININQIF